MFNEKYEEELKQLTDRPETWISLDQMIQKPLASSATTEFTSHENGETEKSNEPKEENDSEKEKSASPPAVDEVEVAPEKKD